MKTLLLLLLLQGPQDSTSTRLRQDSVAAIPSDLYVDSLRSKSRELQWAFDVEKRGRENDRLIYDKQLREIDASNQRQQWFTILSVVAFIIILIILLYILYNQKKRSDERTLQLENEIRHLKEVKARMFGLIARDIRQPLGSFTNITRSFVGTMSTLSQEETIGFLKNLHTTIVDLRQSLNNISNWAVIESEEMPLRRESINCIQLAQEAVRELEPSLRQKELTVDYFIPDQQQVYADKIMVSLVLQNLLSNAIKFSHHKGQLTIFSGKKDNLVTLGIKDQGIGISEEEIKKLFDVNVSLNDKLANRSRGVGLLICRELIEKNGGNMYVESTAGKGSSFYFSLPESKIS